MQNRYAGDIGDYIKLSLLRHICPGKTLGVNWYLYPNENHNADGRHTAYLSDPQHWRPLDPGLFDTLKGAVTGERSVKALEQCLGVSPVFFSVSLPTNGPASERSAARSAWFQRSLQALSHCDLVFADPDNGLVSDDAHRRKDRTFGKRIPLSEVQALCAGRTAVIYHHNSRFKGGHDAEVDHWLQMIGLPSIAVRASAYSCRTFFIINPDNEIRTRTAEFCERWKSYKIRLHGTA